MIRREKFDVCDACGRPSYRTARDENGEQLLLCDRCPSPEEIRRLTETIREKWTDEDHHARRCDCGRSAAAQLRYVYRHVPLETPRGRERPSFLPP